MKKKIVSIIVALSCALTSMVLLAACESSADNLWVSSASNTPSGNSFAVNITYGETPKLDYKLYLHYKNGNNEEISLTDEKLTAEYYFTGEGDRQQLQKLPDEYLAGEYEILYKYDGSEKLNAVVYIQVARAETGAFTVEPAATSWCVFDKSPELVVKTPKGLPVQYLLSDALKTDDTNGNMEMYIIEKSAYDAFDAADKTDYDFIKKYIEQQRNATESSRNMWSYVPGTEEYLPVGDYKVFATISQTHNYVGIVTPAVNVKIKDTFIERTFTLQNIVVQDSDGNVVTDEENEFVGMAASLAEYNKGKTVVCKENGEVRGTVDFGAGVFNELNADEVYTFTAYGTQLTLLMGDTWAGEGTLTDKTLTLKVAPDPAHLTYFFIITFTCK